MVSVKQWLIGLYHNDFFAVLFRSRRAYSANQGVNTLKSNDKSAMSRITDTTSSVNFEDRRKNGERRVLADRRAQVERRIDTRNSAEKKKRSLRTWFRSLTNARLGVDRRKGDRRSGFDRRQKNLHSLLSQNEIQDLLSE